MNKEKRQRKDVVEVPRRSTLKKFYRGLDKTETFFRRYSFRANSLLYSVSFSKSGTGINFREKTKSYGSLCFFNLPALLLQQYIYEIKLNERKELLAFN